MKKYIFPLLVSFMLLYGCSQHNLEKIITQENIAHKTPTTKNITITNETNKPLAIEKTFTIASWNIENWGQSKSSNPQIMRFIAKELSQYDIIAIQEISNINEQTDPNCSRNIQTNNNKDLIKNSLETYLNQELNKNYKFIISPQVKDERYMYVYNGDKITIEDSFIMTDPTEEGEICASKKENYGLMVRQPYIAMFKIGNFNFTLMTVHTSPSQNIAELEGLNTFYTTLEQQGYSDIIILGDLNADCSYLKEDSIISLRDPHYIWVIPNNADTTVSKTDCAYDRFIFTKPTQEDFTGEYGIISDIPDNVSDHYLIWSKFKTDADTN